MLTTAVVLLLFAIVAAFVGFGGATAASIATFGQLASVSLLLLSGVAFFMGRSRTRSQRLEDREGSKPVQPTQSP